MDPMSLAIKYGWILVVVVLVIVLEKLLLRYFFGTVIVSKDQIGIVNKKWVLVGSHRTLPDGAIVALNGEAGLQADTLAPGIHFGLWAWQYSVYAGAFYHNRQKPDRNCGGARRKGALERARAGQGG